MLLYSNFNESLKHTQTCKGRQGNRVQARGLILREAPQNGLSAQDKTTSCIATNEAYYDPG